MLPAKGLNVSLHVAPPNTPSQQDAALQRGRLWGEPLLAESHNLLFSKWGGCSNFKPPTRGRGILCHASPLPDARILSRAKGARTSMLAFSQPTLGLRIPGPRCMCDRLGVITGGL